MTNDTYEFEKRDTKLETYEWDNVWWEHTEKDDAPRVLYIGDSISYGTRKVINRMADGRLMVDHFGTSKAVDNSCFWDAIRLFAKQMRRCDAVLFNNGLHGFHLDDTTDYAEYYEKTVCFLREEFPSVPLILVLTTSLADAKMNARVQARNAAVLAVAERYGLRVLDFYAVSQAHPDLRLEDGVHFKTEGYEIFAQTMIDYLLPLMKA